MFLFHKTLANVCDKVATDQSNIVGGHCSQAVLTAIRPPLFLPQVHNKKQDTGEPRQKLLCTQHKGSPGTKIQHITRFNAPLEPQERRKLILCSNCEAFSTRAMGTSSVASQLFSSAFHVSGRRNGVSTVKDYYCY